MEADLGGNICGIGWDIIIKVFKLIIIKLKII